MRQVGTEPPNVRGRPPRPHPSYVDLHRAGELERRSARALGLLEGTCRVCPRGCKVDRFADERALCAIGRYAVVASHFPHFGEEDCLRGRNGSGTIFFSGCNLRCVFCQNWDISWEVHGEEVTPVRLAKMMLEVQSWGCHHVNWVTPEHVVPQILEALTLAVDAGLRLPIVYNTSAYDSLDSLELLDGIVDIYMPDLKFWTADRARRYSRRADYPEIARRNILEMQRQVGALVMDADGLATHGLLVRHLVMPGMLDETDAVLRWIAAELGSDTYVNLMQQYYPAGLVGSGDGYREIDRRLWSEEYVRALDLALKLGLRLDHRSVTAARSLRSRLVSSWSRGARSSSNRSTSASSR